MRMIIFILLLINLPCLASNVTVPTPSYSGPRDANVVGTALNQWSTEQMVMDDNCGLFCVTSSYITPVAPITGINYIDTDGKVYSTYPTAEPEIGIIYMAKDMANGDWVPIRGSSLISVFNSPTWIGRMRTVVRTRLVFVKNNQNKSVNYNIGPVKIGTASTNTGRTEDIFLSPLAFSLTPLTCSVYASANKIVLGDIKESELPQIGSTTSKKNIQINFDCPANVTVKGYLVDILHPSNTGKALLINEDNLESATGVAINIYTNRTGSSPLPFGFDSNIAGGVNELFILPAVWMPYKESLTLSASVIRTGKLTAGKINALLGITFSYQ
ncbi:fimbrial protein [Salmonella enterica]|nr:hypothetical protein [Salmonella enterica]EDN6746554.1 fimbrial protein [Salmonella enterica]ELI0025937.1 fimbrial protein [Salmonella enterica]ELI0151734.1 fimbrial protein [Salmonella enterica]